MSTGKLDTLRLVRNALELALDDIASSTAEMPHERVIARVHESIATLYVAFDTAEDDPSHHAAIQESAAQIAEADALLAQCVPMPGNVTAVERPKSLLEDALRLLRERWESILERSLSGRSVRSAPSPLAAPSRFRLSQTTPTLHVLSRPRVTMPAPASPPKPPASVETAESLGFTPPKSLAELAEVAATLDAKGIAMLFSEPAATPAPTAPAPFLFDVAVEERFALRSLARDTLEDIGVLSGLRKPIPTESWLDQGPFEQRLLDNLDYFASLGGGALATVPIYYREKKIPDPARAFAVAFTLGCIEGTDVVDLALGLLQRSPPEESEGWVDAFGLAPNPNIDDGVQQLLQGRSERMQHVSLRILAARASLRLESAKTLTAPSLRLPLVRALSTCADRQGAIDLVTDVMTRDTAADTLFVAGVEALLRLGHTATRDTLRSEIDNGSSKERRHASLRLLALCGGEADGERLLVSIGTAPTPATVAALGRFGHVRACGLLLELLRHPDAELVEAAADALDRITGAGMHETVQVPWDIVADPELERFRELKPTRSLERSVRDAERWNAWWKQNQSRFDVELKHRHGLPFRVEMLVTELEARATSPAQRLDAALELALATRSSVPFSTTDWVGRQLELLRLLHSEARRIDAPAGAWCFGGHGALKRPARPSMAPASVAAIASQKGAVAAAIATTLDLDDYARLCAELEVPDAIVESIYGRYGLHDPAKREQLRTEWVRHLGTDRAARDRWERTYEAHKFELAARTSGAPGGRPSAPPIAMPYVPPAPSMPLEEFALLCVELEKQPANADWIYSRHGLADAVSRSAVDQAWKQRLAQVPEEQTEFEKHVAQLRADWIDFD